MASKAGHIEALMAAIILKHRCRAVHRETVVIHEKTEADETVWEGLVSVFDLSGHRKAKVCYAWPHFKPNGKVKLITVLGSRTIDSPRKAVQAAIFFDAGNGPHIQKSPS